MYTYWCSIKINKQAQVKIKPQEIKLRETTLSRKRLTQMIQLMEFLDTNITMIMLNIGVLYIF